MAKKRITKKRLCETCGGSGIIETPPDQTGVFYLKCPGCRPAEVEFTKEVRRKIDEMDEGKIEHPRETEDAKSLEEYRKIWWNVLLALKGAEK